MPQKCGRGVNFVEIFQIMFIYTCRNAIHVLFFIRNLFIRKLGWESQKNKKKSKKKARVN